MMAEMARETDFDRQQTNSSVSQGSLWISVCCYTLEVS